MCILESLAPVCLRMCKKTILASVRTFFCLKKTEYKKIVSAITVAEET